MAPIQGDSPEPAELRLLGRDLELENTLNRLNEKLYQGVLPAPGSSEILVNIDVAERMNLKPGDRIRLSAHAPNQSRIDYTARISGVISDEQLPGSALTDLDALSRRLGIPGRAERLNLIFQRRLTDEEAAGILGLFQKAGLPARSWKSDSPIYQMIESGKPIIDIYLFFFFFLAGLVALNTALINLFQQHRSIGILLAMGYSRGRVAANFSDRTADPLGFQRAVGNSDREFFNNRISGDVGRTPAPRRL